MTRRPCTLLVLIALATPGRALAGDFVDARLTISFGDDDVLRDANDPAATPSPIAGFGDRSGYLFPFDSLNSKYTGRESLTHLVLYRRFPGFFASIMTEAAFVAVLQLTESKLTPADAGSYLRVRYAPGLDPRRAISLTAFPFDSDRFRLGHLYRISVGGSGLYARRAWFGAPGVRLQLDWKESWYFAGFKALPMTSGEEPSEPHYSAIAGAGWDLFGNRLRIDLGGGYFSLGESPVKEVLGSRVIVAGASARVVVHHPEMPIEESIDLMLYRNDPNLPMLLFRPVQYGHAGPRYLVSAEAITLFQRLADPDRFAFSTFQRAVAGALQARMQLGYTRIELTAMVRELSFLYLEKPGFVPYTAFPADAILRPELLFAITADHHFPRAHLTLAATGGLQMPAYVRTQLYATEIGTIPPTLIGDHVITTVDGIQSILPNGENARPLIYGRVQARIDLSEMLAALIWAQYKYDGNTTVVQLNADLTKSRVFSNPHQPGFGISGAVRF